MYVIKLSRLSDGKPQVCETRLGLGKCWCYGLCERVFVPLMEIKTLGETGVEVFEMKFK